MREKEVGKMTREELIANAALFMSVTHPQQVPST